MPRPTTKSTLLEAAKANYEKMFELIDALPKGASNGTFPFEDRDRNVRDVLAHLHEWHLMMLDWYKVGMSGAMPAIPAKGYTWQMLPELNQVIFEKYQRTPLGNIRKKLDETHQKLLALIQSHSDKELFTKKLYPWTKTTSLGAYFISSTSSHYDWALKKLKRYQRALKTQ